MRIRALVAFLVLAILAGCDAQSPMNPDGTLPVVTGLALREDACKGDTLFFTWDSVGVEIDDFGLWFSDNPLFVWFKAGDFRGTTGEHVADRCHTYAVWAQREDGSHSMSLSSRVMLATNWLGQAVAPAEDFVPGFSLSVDTILAGDATNPEFAQDFFLSRDLMGYMIYGGDTDPRRCPGGRQAMLAPALGDAFKAPHPESPLWTDTLSLLSAPRFFIRLEDGHYGRFTAMVYTNPESLLVAEVNCSLQPLRNVRLFE
jgi:hypothetical protein